jgi:hypothetical protein
MTGTVNAGDLTALKSYLDKNVWSKDNNPVGVEEKDRLTRAFQSNLLTLVKRGYAPLADYLEKQGVDQAWRPGAAVREGFRRGAEAHQDAVLRTASREDSKFGDALGLASKLAQYGGKVGLLGLANRSGTSVGDTLGLVTSYPDVFSKLGTSAKTLLDDLDRLKQGQQPIPAYATGTPEIRRDHVAMVHQGETVLPGRTPSRGANNMRPAAGGSRRSDQRRRRTSRCRPEPSLGSRKQEVLATVERSLSSALRSSPHGIRTGTGTR